RRILADIYEGYSLLWAGHSTIDIAQRALSAAKHNREFRRIVAATCLLGDALVAQGASKEARSLLYDVLPIVESMHLGDLYADVLNGISRSWLKQRSPTAYKFAHNAEIEARRGGNRLQLADS